METERTMNKKIIKEEISRLQKRYSELITQESDPAILAYVQGQITGLCFAKGVIQC